MRVSGASYYDISPPLSAATAVFPGDVNFHRAVSLDFSKGDHLLLSSIQTTLHLGAHADAPNHYRAGLEGIDDRDLSLYMGPAQVIRVDVKRSEKIRPEHIAHARIQAPRVLFFTGTFPDPNRWNSDFASLHPDLVDHLAQKGVRLVGIDTPSIDPEDSKGLDAHQRVADHDLAVLEGVVLQDVPAGLYTLLALPLRLTGADASPVRAILLTDSTVLFQDLK